MKLKYSLFSGLLLFIFSCRPQDKMEIIQSASAFDLTQAKAAINQSALNLVKNFKKGDTAAILNAYTKNAMILPSGHAPLETDSIRYYLIRLLNSNVAEIDFDSQNVWGDSTLLAEIGTYTLKGKNNTELDKGKFIILWMRESGNWKIYRQMSNSNLIKDEIQFDSLKVAGEK